ncbi:hypothetical protein GGQ05_000794 [Salinibacter ruber]|nr:hypothetical protein [Salinibacter ruber]
MNSETSRKMHYRKELNKNACPQFRGQAKMGQQTCSILLITRRLSDLTGYIADSGESGEFQSS